MGHILNIRYDLLYDGVLPLYDAMPDMQVWNSSTLTGCRGEWVNVGHLRRAVVLIGMLARRRFEAELRRRCSKLTVKKATPETRFVENGHILCSVKGVDNKVILFGLAYIPLPDVGESWPWGTGEKRFLKYSLPSRIVVDHE